MNPGALTQPAPAAPVAPPAPAASELSTASAPPAAPVAPAAPPRPTMPPARAGKPGMSGLLIGLALVTVGLLGMAPLALTALQRDARTLREPSLTLQVSAEGMRFSPAELRVPAGASVAVEFVNRDPTTPHDFQTTRQYRDSRIVLWPGERRSTVFIAADTPGRYTFLCTVRGHAEAGMTGVLIVE